MQIKFSTMFCWLFSMADSTVSSRFHCDGCARLHLEGASITKLVKSTVRSGSLLGNKRYLLDQTL